MTGKLIELLGLPADTGEDEIISTITTLRVAVKYMEDLGELLGVEANTAKVKGAVVALQQAGETVERLRGEINQLKAERTSDQAREAVTRALQAGKIPPAAQDWAQDFAQTDLGGFETFVSGAPAIWPGGDNLGGQDGPAARMETGLSADELFMAQTMGITPEQFKISRDSLVSSGDYIMSQSADRQAASREGGEEIFA